MKHFTATATCDWGYIYSGKIIAASNWRAAGARAFDMAHREARRRPGFISVRVDAIKEQKETAPEGADSSRAES